MYTIWSKEVQILKTRKFVSVKENLPQEKMAAWGEKVKEEDREDREEIREVRQQQKMDSLSVIKWSFNFRSLSTKIDPPVIFTISKKSAVSLIDLTVRYKCLVIICNSLTAALDLWNNRMWSRISYFASETLMTSAVPCHIQSRLN